MDMANFDLEFLSQGGISVQRHSAGDKIFSTGENGRHMFVVRAGRVDIIRYGTVLENVRAGDIFGEMALIDQSPRSAMAVAHDDVELIPVDEPAFQYLVQHQPGFALFVMQKLTARLRRATENV